VSGSDIVKKRLYSNKIFNHILALLPDPYYIRITDEGKIKGNITDEGPEDIIGKQENPKHSSKLQQHLNW
jgi:hypothetical protein